MKHHDTKHHRKPRSLGGETSERNISMIPKDLHEAWHRLFQNFTPEDIAREINERYLDPDWKFVAIPRGERWIRTIPRSNR